MTTDTKPENMDTAKPSELLISIVTYQNDEFDIIFKDKCTSEEISFAGKREIDDAELEFINKIAPACVWTPYTRTPAQPTEEGELHKVLTAIVNLDGSVEPNREWCPESYQWLTEKYQRPDRLRHGVSPRCRYCARWQQQSRRYNSRSQYQPRPNVP